MTFAALLLALIAAAVVTGVVPTRHATYDVAFFGDAGWRALSGQRPHVDFHSPFGAGFYVLIYAGLWLSGGTWDGIGYIGALIGFLVALWGYLLFRRALGPVAVSAAAGATLYCSRSGHAMFL